jgi:dihydroorotate dehydrogenase (NAD+) catalytic subunit
MVDMSVTLSGMKLDNPVIPASGTFGFGYEFRDYYDLNILGSLAVKSVTLEERFGNRTPRVTECEGGMLNAVGLQNPGLDSVIERELPRLRGYFRKPIIASVSGFSVEEYARLAAALSVEDQVALIEVNVSCPNVKRGNMIFGSDPLTAAEVTRAVKAVSKRPVYIKLSPNVANIADIARACESAGADGISLINTLVGMRLNIKNRRPILANITGGLSGPAIFPIALRMVWEVKKAVAIPIMGIGGLASSADVIEMMMAGATAVQIGSANIKNPRACLDIINGLPYEMERLGIERLSGIIGAAHC